ncbi:MAG: hypothetical protein COA58_03230 [Bacteroidetes bacterium]|nr:MAG: hypothetical protein COA58_03230 [Bacteroidota bacterium]
MLTWANRDTCPVWPDPFHYYQLSVPINYQMIEGSDFFTYGGSLSYQMPNRLQVGIDIFGAKSNSKSKDRSLFKYAVLTNFGYEFLNTNRSRWTAKYKSSIGFIHQDAVLQNPVNLIQVNQKRYVYLIKTGLSIEHAFKTRISFYTPVISLNLGYSSTLGDINSSPDINETFKPIGIYDFKGFHAGISLGVQLHKRKKSSGMNF